MILTKSQLNTCLKALDVWYDQVEEGGLDDEWNATTASEIRDAHDALCRSARSARIEELEAALRDIINDSDDTGHTDPIKRIAEQALCHGPPAKDES